MSAIQLISLLVLPALATWLFATSFIYLIFNPIQKKKFLGFSFHGMLPANKELIIAAVTESISNIFLKDEILQKSLLHSDAINKLKPEIETHVDVFLREKLKENFPMMHQLMGEKTLSRFKEVFLNEVEELLPVIIQKHSAGLIESNTVQQLISNKLNSVTINEIEIIFKRTTAKKLFHIKVYAVVIGLMVGFFQILLVLLLNQNTQ